MTRTKFFSILFMIFVVCSLVYATSPQWPQYIPSTPTNTLEIGVLPTFPPDPTREPLVKPDPNLPIPPQPELVAKATGFLIDPDVAARFDMILKYDRHELVLDNTDVGFYFTLKHPDYEYLTELYHYDGAASYQIPLIKDGVEYLPYTGYFIKSHSGRMIAFVCDYLDEAHNSWYETQCVLDTITQQLDVFPLPFDVFAKPEAYHIAFIDDQVALVSAGEMDHSSSDQVFKWDLTSDIVTQNSFLPVSHREITIDSTGTFAVTESETFDPNAPQYLQVYRAATWSFEGAVIRGFFLGWVGQELFYVTGDECGDWTTENCTHIIGYNPNTDVQTSYFNLPKGVEWTNFLWVNPTGEYIVFAGESGPKGLFACTMATGHCEQVTPAAEGQYIWAWGFLDDHVLLIESNDQYQLVNTHPSR